jgi:hypothetical protein
MSPFNRHMIESKKMTSDAGLKTSEISAIARQLLEFQHFGTFLACLPIATAPGMRVAFNPMSGIFSENIRASYSSGGCWEDQLLHCSRCDLAETPAVAPAKHR